MQGMPNRMGLGMRPPAGAYGMGQGPSMSALAQQQQMANQQFAPQQAQRPQHNLFVGSISGGITDGMLTELLSACGQVRAFKRMITPANKPQGFGFAEFEDPDGMMRAVNLLNGVELPALEESCVSKKLLVKADEKTKLFLDAYSSQKMRTDADEAALATAQAKIQEMLAKMTELATKGAPSEKDRFVIPPHLHDLQEADLPEEQRGLVVSEIALFRERAAKREREKIKEDRERTLSAFGNNFGSGQSSTAPPNAPSGPKWGKQPPSGPGRQHGFGNGNQGYNKPVGFVRAEDGRDRDASDRDSSPGQPTQKSDLEMELDRKDTRKREEDMSFRDRERRYEPRERQRIAQLERTLARERNIKEAQERDRVEMRRRLDIWDDDESDETFYTDRLRWRVARRRRLDQEEEADRQSKDYAERQAEHLRQESEQFLARQMAEMQSLQEEQRKAGMLLDDSAPVKLNMSMTAGGSQATLKTEPSQAKVALGQEDEEENAQKKKLTLTKLEFSFSETGTEKIKERLEKIRQTVPKERETLFKSKVRWDGMSDVLIDRKLEPLVRRSMTHYLGELDDDDLVMFVVEHLKDHKSPAKLVEGLEPVLVDEAEEFVVTLWRQIIFESMAYDDGINTGSMLVD